MPPDTPQSGAPPKRRSLMLALLAGAIGVHAAEPRGGARADDWLELKRLAPGVFTLPGSAAPPGAANRGRVGNLGFLIGRDGVVVIDTGSSAARARELLAAIRSQTELPVAAVLISHPAQEFLFGNAPFADRGVPVLSDAATPRLMRERCENCLQTLTTELGAARMAGTRLVLPQPLPFATPEVELGGRALSIVPGPAGTVPGNLLIRDPASGVVFAGALLSVGRVPAVQDTRPLQWRDALGVLQDRAIHAVVPAYGPVAWQRPGSGQVGIAAAVAQLQRYLEDLEDRAQALFRAGIPLAEVGPRGELPAYRHWNAYPANHLHNIFYRYLQLEADDLASP